jgi:hypothetical protein
MKQRVLQSISVAVTIAAVSLLMGTVGRQTTRAESQAAQSDAALKTSWGEPNLAGIWGVDVQIPLQRPARFAEKESFTDAELAELDKERTSKPTFGEKRAERGTERDLAGAYDSTVFLTKRPTGRRTALIVDPPDGRLPPLTPQVQQRNKELRDWQLALTQSTDSCKNGWRGCEGGTYNAVPSERRFDPYKYYPVGIINRADQIEDHGLGMRCLSANMPDFVSGGTGGIWGIAQSPGAVSIFYDTGQGQGWHRTIPVDGSPHLPASIRFWWGDSRGHWEGNTLVVDVTNFNGKNEFQGSRENRHIIERWTRTSPTTIEYVVTLEDPTTWTKPWTAKQEFVKQSDERNRIYKEPRCVEGNYSVFGMLSGARAKDLAFAEGRGPDPSTFNFATSTNSALDDEDLDDLN